VTAVAAVTTTTNDGDTDGNIMMMTATVVATTVVVLIMVEVAVTTVPAQARRCGSGWSGRKTVESPAKYSVFQYKIFRVSQDIPVQNIQSVRIFQYKTFSQ
jgi:hypothetical protein